MLIKFIHINIYQKLRGKITEWEAFARFPFCIKTINNVPQ